MDNVSERIRELRKELNLTQNEFGGKLGVSQVAIAQYEAGTRKITDRTIIQLCQIFNANENWLRTGKGSKFSMENDPIGAIASMYNIGIDGRALIEAFISLTDEQRSALITAAERAAEKAKELRKINNDFDAETERLIELLRQEREAEKKGVQESSPGPSEKRA